MGFQEHSYLCSQVLETVSVLPHCVFLVRIITSGCRRNFKLWKERTYSSFPFAKVSSCTVFIMESVTVWLTSLCPSVYMIDMDIFISLQSSKFPYIFIPTWFWLLPLPLPLFFLPVLHLSLCIAVFLLFPA